jgi:hypothetical protein
VTRKKAPHKVYVSVIFDLGSSGGSNIAKNKHAMIGEAYAALHLEKRLARQTLIFPPLDDLQRGEEEHRGQSD